MRRCGWVGGYGLEFLRAGPFSRLFPPPNDPCLGPVREIDPRIDQLHASLSKVVMVLQAIETSLPRPTTNEQELLDTEGRDNVHGPPQRQLSVWFASPPPHIVRQAPSYSGKVS